MTIHPSNGGIAFRLGSERVTASPDNVTDTNRRTRLGSINTVEHIMSALAGLEITDAEVELSAPEVPGADGSSIPFVKLLQTAGFENGEEQTVPDLYRRLYPPSETSSISIAKGTGHWRYTFETGDRWPGTQTFELESVVSGYVDQIAPAITTAFSFELEAAEKLGLGKGLDKDSVLILDPEGYRFPARFPDEPARHKLLDLIGDLYLTGIPIRALDVVSSKSGHTANVQAAMMLKSATSAK